MKKHLKTTIACAGAAIAAAAGIWFAPAQPWNPGRALNAHPAAVGPAAIPALAPAASDTFVMAPATEDWWRKVAAMAYSGTALTGLDPAKAGVVLDRIGYTQSPDGKDRGIGPTGPLRLFYAEAPTEADAQKAAEWLRQATGWENRKVFVQGRVVIVAPNWVDTYQAPDKAITTVPGYTTDNSPSASTYWLNVDQQTADLLGPSPHASTADAAQALVHEGLGFKPGTTWLGTGTNGSSWSGRFASGGVDASKASPDQVNTAVQKTQTVLGSAGNTTVQPISSIRSMRSASVPCVGARDNHRYVIARRAHAIA